MVGSWKFEKYENGKIGNPELFKHKQILLNPKCAWKTMEYFEICLSFAWVQNDRLLPVFPKNRILQWRNLDKSPKNPKKVPSTPQHTDSHPCTRPGWSRSLSGWSRSLETDWELDWAIEPKTIDNWLIDELFSNNAFNFQGIEQQLNN